MEKYTYEVNEKTQIIQRSDGAAIPMDEGNSDYQAYLKRDEPQVEHLTSPLTDPTA